MADGIINPDGSVTLPDGSTVSPNGIVTPPPSLGQVISGAVSSGFMYLLQALISIPTLLFGLMLVLVDFVVTLFLDLIVDLIKMSDLQGMIDKLPSSDFLPFMFHLLAFDYGIPLILSASIVKFLIRRIPFVG